MKFGHHSRTYLEGLTKFWSFWGSSAPPYSPFCTLRMLTFDPKPFLNPTLIPSPFKPLSVFLQILFLLPFTQLLKKKLCLITPPLPMKLTPPLIPLLSTTITTTPTLRMSTWSHHQPHHSTMTRSVKLQLHSHSTTLTSSYH